MNIKQYFEDGILELHKDEEPVSDNLLLAVILILTECALSDSVFDAEELTKIVESITENFNASTYKVGEVIEIIDFVRNDTKNFEERSNRLFEKVNSSFTVIQKQKILGIAWKILHANGEISPEEAAKAANLRKRLGLSLEQSVWARSVSVDSPEGPAKDAEVREEDESHDSEEDQ